MLDEEDPLPPEIAPGDLPYDAGDAAQVAERKTDEGRRDKRLRDTLGGIVSVPQGREWIAYLLDQCNVFTMSYVAGQPDMTAYNEGRRSVGNLLLDTLVRQFPEAYIKMMQERGGRNG